MTGPDPIADAIAQAADGAFVTHYVVVAALIDEDGEPLTYTMTSPGLPLWMRHGLLSYEAAAAIPQPEYERPDEDEDDDE